MAKSRPARGPKSNRKAAEKSILNGTQPARKPTKKKPLTDPATLLAQATALLQTSQPLEALSLSLRALATLRPNPEQPTEAALPALNLLGEIQLELGCPTEARDYFLLATSLDPEGLVPESQGGGAEKFLWLAQLCEEGGKRSVEWFEKGVRVLKRELGEIESLRLQSKEGGADDIIEAQEKEKRRKLAGALCGVVEVYMTDLSWEPDAESRCEALVTEALLTDPSSPEPLQTLASVRLSQSRLSDAQAALQRSIGFWKDLPPEDSEVPDFPTRISLARLLMEAEMEEEGIVVLERLVSEDDESVEAWYLGGWCLVIMVERQKEGKSSGGATGGDEEEWTAMLEAGRDWLRKSLELYERLEYEDERMRDHAVELVEGLDGLLVSTVTAEEEDGAADEDWEDEVDDGHADDDEIEVEWGRPRKRKGTTE